jgi:hypothetical protein
MATSTQRNLNPRQSFGRPSGDERPNPTREEVSRLAYELYQKRGRAHGNDWGDWLQAEAILKRGVRR